MTHFTFEQLEPWLIAEYNRERAEAVKNYLIEGKSRGYEVNGPNAASGEFWDIQDAIHEGYCRAEFPNGCAYFCEKATIATTNAYGEIRKNRADS